MTKRRRRRNQNGSARGFSAVHWLGIALVAMFLLWTAALVLSEAIRE